MIICPECETKNSNVLPGFNSLSKIHKRPDGKPDFCQTCLKARLAWLEEKWKDDPVQTSKPLVG